MWKVLNKEVDLLNTDRTGKPVYSVGNYLFAERVSARSEFKNFIVSISVTADGSLLSSTGGVNTIPPEPEIHEQIYIYI